MTNDTKVEYSCPCCGHTMHSEYGEGSYEICDHCWWEDCGVRDPDEHSGPNHMTLGEGRKEWLYRKSWK